MTPEAEAFRKDVLNVVGRIVINEECVDDTAARLYDEHTSALRSLLGVREEELRAAKELLDCGDGECDRDCRRCAREHRDAEKDTADRLIGQQQRLHAILDSAGIAVGCQDSLQYRIERLRDERDEALSGSDIPVLTRQRDLAREGLRKAQEMLAAERAKAESWRSDCQAYAEAWSLETKKERDAAIEALQREQAQNAAAGREVSRIMQHVTDERDAAREQMRLNAEALEAAKADHHAPGRWTTCAACVQFFRQDEDGAAENARLREHRTRLQEHNTELIERARVAEKALADERDDLDAAAKACRNETERDAAFVRVDHAHVITRRLTKELAEKTEEVEGWRKDRIAAHERIQELLASESRLLCRIAALEARLKDGEELVKAGRDLYEKAEHWSNCTIHELGRVCSCGLSVAEENWTAAFTAWDAGREPAKLSRPCCERDHDGDGNCDRHPVGFPPASGIGPTTAQVQRIADLEDFVRDIRDNWDCDEDAHRTGTLCRCCEAGRLLPKAEPEHGGGRS